MVEIRRSTIEDIKHFFGHRHKNSMRAYTAVLDGEPVGVAGIYYDGVRIIAFSIANEEARKKYKFAVYKMAKKVVDILQERNIIAYAIADPEIEGSDKLLRHLGFNYVGPCKEGEVYQWNPVELRRV